MGSVWARLGSKVTVIEFMDSLLPTMDQEIVRDFKKTLEAQGLQFKLGTKCTAYENKKGKALLTLETKDGAKETIEGSHVLVSVGRSPFTEELGLEEAGITKDARGFVSVNDRFETNVKNVYAIGDLIGGAMLAHKAEEEGVLLAETLAGKKGQIDYALIPGVIYTDPEVASIGFTEEELKLKNVSYIKGSFPYLANGRAIAMGKLGGKIKILAHSQTHKVLGVHIIGAQASTLIGEAVIAMNKRMTLEDMAHACHPHPTLTEAMKEAAMAALGHAIHI
jgi:dihydrolipoamide dehydrogenase